MNQPVVIDNVSGRVGGRGRGWNEENWGENEHEMEGGGPGRACQMISSAR